MKTAIAVFGTFFWSVASAFLPALAYFSGIAWFERDLGIPIALAFGLVFSLTAIAFFEAVAVVLENPSWKFFASLGRFFPAIIGLSLFSTPPKDVNTLWSGLMLLFLVGCIILIDEKKEAVCTRIKVYCLQLLY